MNEFILMTLFILNLILFWLEEGDFNETRETLVENGNDYGRGEHVLKTRVLL